MKNLFLALTAIVFSIASVSSASADLIVQWGGTDGAATNPVPNAMDIVTANQNFSSKPTTYANGTAANPAVGANYYPNATGRTPIFNSAASMTRGAGALTIQTAQIQNNANHDRIRLVGTDTGTSSDLTAVEAMVAWESANWLSTANTLETMSHVGFRQNKGNSEFRFLLQKDDDSWFASTAQAWTGGGTATGDFFITDASAEDWYAFTPLNAGVGTVGTLDNTLTVDNVKSVGFYFKSTGNGVTSMGFQTGYFQATAVPEPTSLALFGLCGLGLFSRRRK